MDTKEHWDDVYTHKPTEKLSWSTAHLVQSLALFAKAGISKEAGVIDVGAGASSLPVDLVEQGYRDISVLDISQSAIERARAGMGNRAGELTWVVGDVRTVPLEEARYALWHDRALFHFLTKAEDREAYMRQLLRTLRPDGWVIMATFALDGPQACSGLPVQRYDRASMERALGSNFELVHSNESSHQTPWGSEQRFLYCLARRIDDAYISG